MKTGNRLTAARGDGVGGFWVKEREGTSQRAGMNDPWMDNDVGSDCGSRAEG